MKYPYIVVKNGIWYPSGSDVPDGYSDIQDEKNYSKTDINRMPLAELKKLAETNLIDGFEKMTGSELKKKLIQIYNL